MITLAFNIAAQGIQSPEDPSIKSQLEGSARNIKGVEVLSNNLESLYLA